GAGKFGAGLSRLRRGAIVAPVACTRSAAEDLQRCTCEFRVGNHVGSEWTEVVIENATAQLFEPRMKQQGLGCISAHRAVPRDQTRESQFSRTGAWLRRK